MLTVYRLFLKQISFLMSIRMTGTRGDGWPETTLPPLFLSQTHISIIVYCTVLLTSSDSSSYVWQCFVSWYSFSLYIFIFLTWNNTHVYLCLFVRKLTAFSQIFWGERIQHFESWSKSTVYFCQFQANWTGYSLNQFSNVWLVSCWCLMAMFLHNATYDVSNISLMSLMMYLGCHKMCVLTSYIFGWLGFWQGEC